MPIKYVPSGDEFKASQRWGEGRHQLSILKNSMSFQTLDQMQRLVPFDDGTLIKCSSCFDQDVVEVFVPLGLEAGRPKYRERIRTRYLPAFEAYDGQGAGKKFLGVVLCEGDGFEPPYRFVAKESLPTDYSDRPSEELPAERIWAFFEPSGIEGMDNDYTGYRDIVPSGVAKADLVDSVPVIAEEDLYGGAGDWFVRTCKKLFTFEACTPTASFFRYYARGNREYGFTRIEHLKRTFGFSYGLLGDESPGAWPPYAYDGASHSGGNKPQRLLNFNEDFYYEIRGHGQNQFLSDNSSIVSRLAMKLVDGECVADPTVNFESVAALLPASGGDLDFEFPKRYYFCEMTDHTPITRYPVLYIEYTWTTNNNSPFYSGGSVMDADHYALVYSMSLGGETNFYDKPPVGRAIVYCIAYSPCADPMVSCTEVPATRHTNVNRNEGPLCVVVDGVVFELFSQAQPENAPRLQLYEIKYFKVSEDLSIGMFCIAKNYNYPFDYMYVYVEVTSDGQKSVVTPIDEQYHLIPGVTGTDGEELYGGWNFRLILEEIKTTEEVK